MSDVCQTIAFAHDNRVIHRDLKPSNIVTGKFGETYVIDWGLARRNQNPEENELPPASGAAALDSGLTQHGTAIGTPAYMSPEQVAGEQVGPASDIFNLGATLYCILIGHSPYHSDSLTENLKNAQAASFMKPHEKNEAVPRAASAILDVC